MAISPTYTWMLVFRLIQGLVSKAGWMIGYILSKNPCDGRWGSEGRCCQNTTCQMEGGAQKRGLRFKSMSKDFFPVSKAFLKSFQ